jgi:formamidopyrimidine-DNA glycosylase
MPEGHTIHRAAAQQSRLLAGRDVAVSSPQGRFADSAARVDGRRLERVEAAGKHLFYHWDSGDIGHVHLGLFGRFRVTRGAPPPEPRGAIRMRLSVPDATVDLSGPTTCTLDPPTVREEILARLGPDPLASGADPERMIERIGRSRRAIADLLMDQSVVAGIGNVYRAEILFVNELHPLLPGRSLDEAVVRGLWDTARRMLRAGRRSGRIVTVHRSEVGVAPGGRIPRGEATYVYGRDHCLRCGSPIQTLSIANRSCYFCPTHQREVRGHDADRIGGRGAVGGWDIV